MVKDVCDTLIYLSDGNQFCIMFIIHLFFIHSRLYSLSVYQTYLSILQHPINLLLYISVKLILCFTIETIQKNLAIRRNVQLLYMYIVGFCCWNVIESSVKKNYFIQIELENVLFYDNYKYICKISNFLIEFLQFLSVVKSCSDGRIHRGKLYIYNIFF